MAMSVEFLQDNYEAVEGKEEALQAARYCIMLHGFLTMLVILAKILDCTHNRYAANVKKQRTDNLKARKQRAVENPECVVCWTTPPNRWLCRCGRHTCYACLEAWTLKNPDNLRCPYCQRTRNTITQKENYILDLLDTFPEASNMNIEDVDKFVSRLGLMAQ